MPTPMIVAAVASSRVAGKNRAMSASTAFDVSTERPKSPLQHLEDIEEELLIERQIKAELGPCALIDLGGGAVADRRQHGIDRHDAADQEGDEKQAEEGQQDDQEHTDDASPPLRRTNLPVGPLRTALTMRGPCPSRKPSPRGQGMVRDPSDPAL